MKNLISVLSFLSITIVATAAQSCCPGLTVIIGYFDEADVNAFVPPHGTLDPSRPTTNPAPTSFTPMTTNPVFATVESIKSSPPSPLSPSWNPKPSSASAAPPSAEVGSVEEVVADAIARSVYHARRLADATCEAARSRLVPFANTNDKWQFQPVQMIGETEFLYDMALFNNYWYYEDKSVVPFAKRVAVANVGISSASHNAFWVTTEHSPLGVCSDTYYGGLDLNNVANHSLSELIIRVDPSKMSYWIDALAVAVPCVKTVCPKLHLVEATDDLMKDVQSVLPCCEMTTTVRPPENSWTERTEPTNELPGLGDSGLGDPQSSNSTTLSVSVVPLLLLMFFYSA